MSQYEVQYDRWVSINVLKKRKTSVRIFGVPTRFDPCIS